MQFWGLNKKKVIKYTYLISSILIIFITINSCKNTNFLEKQVITKVKKDAPFLAQLEALYGFCFINRKKNIITSNDIYVRQDKASVFYGYNLNDAEIKVVAKEEGQDILKVKLPAPEKISIDRKAVFIENTHKNYDPKDDEGKPIDIDGWMNNKLNEIVKEYEGKSIEMTKKMSQQYFESLSKRFGLQLDLEFSS